MTSSIVILMHSRPQAVTMRWSANAIRRSTCFDWYPLISPCIGVSCLHTRKLKRGKNQWQSICNVVHVLLGSFEFFLMFWIDTLSKISIKHAKLTSKDSLKCGGRNLPFVGSPEIVHFERVALPGVNRIWSFATTLLQCSFYIIYFRLNEYRTARADL